MSFEEQLQFYKERADHYAQIVPGLVDQIRAATSLSALLERLQKLSEILKSFEKAVSRCNAMTDRLEAATKKLEESQAPEDENEDEPAVAAAVIEVKDPDAFGRVISKLDLDDREAKRFFTFGEYATLELEFRRDPDGGVSIAGSVAENSGRTRD